jgi:murein hydrolase activator
LLPQAAGQSRKELEDKRLKLIEDIDRTNKKLQETQKTKAAALGRYLALKSQVAKRQQLVATMRQEIVQADSAIVRSEELSAALNDDIDRLRREYAQTLRAAYRLKLQQSWVTFLFSADNLNHVFRRRQYMRQYDRHRRRQAALIAETQQALSAKVEQLERYKAEQQRLIAAAQQQGEILRTEMQDKDRALQALKTDENQLVKELERREKERERFSAAIEAVIREEMSQKRREARTSAAITSPATRSNTATAPAAVSKADNSAFAQRRGNMAWPVAGGRISRPFGPQPHPTLRDVTVPNNGVDIHAGPGADVQAVFDGKVVGVQFVPGYQNMVILQHGTYYTVYSNIANLQVARDDQVSAGQVIGRLGQEDLHFEVWREKQRLNPAQWLGKR